MQDHHVIDETRRNAKMPRGFPVTVALIHTRNDTLTQFDRMRLAHGASPFIGKVNHKSHKTGNPNPVRRDTLYVFRLVMDLLLAPRPLGEPTVIIYLIIRCRSS